MKFLSLAFSTVFSILNLAQAQSTQPALTNVYECEVGPAATEMLIVVRADSTTKQVVDAKFSSLQNGVVADETVYTLDQIRLELTSGDEIRRDENTVNMLEMYGVNVKKVEQIKSYRLAKSDNDFLNAFVVLDKSEKVLLKAFAGGMTMPVKCNR